MVTESLPYGNDVDQTVPMQFEEHLPSGVGALLQKEQELHNVAASGSNGSLDEATSPREAGYY